MRRRNNLLSRFIFSFIKLKKGIFNKLTWCHYLKRSRSFFWCPQRTGCRIYFEAIVYLVGCFGWLFWLFFLITSLIGASYYISLITWNMKWLLSFRPSTTSLLSILASRFVAWILIFTIHGTLCFIRTVWLHSKMNTLCLAILIRTIISSHFIRCNTVNVFALTAAKIWAIKVFLSKTQRTEVS